MKKLFLLAILMLVAGGVLADATYYVKATSAKVRSCPQTKCSVLVKLAKGTAITALEEVQGDKVSKSTVWYRISVNGQDGYIHASLVTSTAPAATVTSRGSSRAPRNCKEAVAMGLTAQQAAQYPGLDRDHDGEACYGN